MNFSYKFISIFFFQFFGLYLPSFFLKILYEYYMFKISMMTYDEYDS